jgi:hypothetical protein
MSSEDPRVPTTTAQPATAGDTFLPQVADTVDPTTAAAAAAAAAATTATATGDATTAMPPSSIIGPCALGAACTAKDQELSEQYRCRFCNKQLHGFISGCSQAKNAKDFRDGVICKEQPCFGNGESVHAPVLLPGQQQSDAVVSNNNDNTR